MNRTNHLKKFSILHLIFLICWAGVTSMGVSNVRAQETSGAPDADESTESDSSSATPTSPTAPETTTQVVSETPSPTGASSPKQPNPKSADPKQQVQSDEKKSPLVFSIKADEEKIKDLIHFSEPNLNQEQSGKKKIEFSGTGEPDLLIVTDLSRTRITAEGHFIFTYPLTGNSKKIAVYLTKKSGEVVPVQLSVTLSGVANPPKTSVPIVEKPKIVSVLNSEKKDQDANDEIENNAEAKLPDCKPVPSELQAVDPLDQALFFNPARNGVDINNFIIRSDTGNSKKWIVGEQPFTANSLEIDSVKKEKNLELIFKVPNFFPRFREMTIKVVGDRSDRKVDFLLDRNKSDGENTAYQVDVKFEKSMSFQICGSSSGASSVKACSQNYSYRSEINRLSKISSVSVKPLIRINKKSIQPGKINSALKDKLDISILLPNGARVDVVEKLIPPQYFDVQLNRTTKVMTVNGKATAPFGSIPMTEGTWKIEVPYAQHSFLISLTSGFRVQQKFVIQKCPPAPIHQIFVKGTSPDSTYLDRVPLQLAKANQVKVSDQLADESNENLPVKSADGAPPKSTASNLIDGEWIFAVGKNGYYTTRLLEVDLEGESFVSSHKVYRGYPGQVGIDLISNFNVSGFLSIDSGFSATYWFERAFGSYHKTLAFQRWGVQAKAATRVLNFGNSTIAKESSFLLGINYRFTPGVIYRDPTLIFSLRYHQLLVDDLTLPLYEVGIMWSTEPVGIFKAVLDIVPFLNFPRWMEFGIHGAVASATKFDQNPLVASINAETRYFLKPTLILKFAGALEYLQVSNASTSTKRIQASFNPGLTWLY